MAPPRPLDFSPQPTRIDAPPGARRVAVALRAELADANAAAPEVSQFYQAHGYRPLWTYDRGFRASTAALLTALTGSWRDGLDPNAYLTPQLRRALATADDRRADDIAQAELALSQAYTSYVLDLKNGPSGHRLDFVDPAFGGQATRRSALDFAFRSPAFALFALDRFNPVYERLRAQLGAPGPKGWSDRQNLIRINLDRLRRFPGTQHFLLVDAAAARLSLFDGGKADFGMNVGVGRIDEPTPEMAGLIRFAAFRPYWNVPPDLVRDTLAPKVLASGPSAFAAEGMQALSDWSDQARPLDPASIDWKAVASGKTLLRVRQLPGPDNMMGKIKFMLPNPLGVYLHDTPKKALLAGTRRNVSAGCVRLVDATALARRLLPDPEAPPGAQAEARVDLPEPTPVYITYLTLAPGPKGLEARADVYKRDAALLEALKRYDRRNGA